MGRVGCGLGGKCMGRVGCGLNEKCMGGWDMCWVKSAWVGCGLGEKCIIFCSHLLDEMYWK